MLLKINLEIYINQIKESCLCKDLFLVYIFNIPILLLIIFKIKKSILKYAENTHLLYLVSFNYI